MSCGNSNKNLINYNCKGLDSLLYSPYRKVFLQCNLTHTQKFRPRFSYFTECYLFSLTFAGNNIICQVHVLLVMRYVFMPSVYVFLLYYILYILVHINVPSTMASVCVAFFSLRWLDLSFFLLFFFLDFWSLSLAITRLDFTSGLTTTGVSTTSSRVETLAS